MKSRAWAKQRPQVEADRLIMNVLCNDSFFILNFNDTAPRMTVGDVNQCQAV